MPSLNPDNRSYDLTQQSQVSLAAREVVRLIHKGNLRLDDRLPPQSELVGRMSFSNDTISEAMRALVDAGVLTRKRKAGTVVTDPDRIVRGLWRVGIAIFSAISEPFYAQLLHRVLFHLQEVGCIATLHMLAPGCTRRPPNLSDFGALKQDAEQSIVSGIVSFSDLPMSDWLYLEQIGVPMSYVGAWEHASSGVVIDQAPMVHRAVGLLVGKGCRHLALVHNNDGEFGVSRGEVSYRAAVEQGGLDGRSFANFVSGQGPHAGARVADALLALAPEDRPDGLVVVNDWIGMGLTVRLAADGAYRPKIVVQTNKQAPLAFASPVMHFELDVEQMATRCVEMLLSRMRNPLIPAQREWISPQLSLEEASHMITEPSVPEDVFKKVISS